MRTKCAREQSVNNAEIEESVQNVVPFLIIDILIVINTSYTGQNSFDKVSKYWGTLTTRQFCNCDALGSRNSQLAN